MTRLASYAHSADPDQMPQNAASDLSLHCLLKINSHFCKSDTNNIQNTHEMMNLPIQLFRIEESRGING